MRLCARHRLRRLRPEGRALIAATPVTILANSAATALATSAAAPAAAAPASNFASWDALLQ